MAFPHGEKVMFTFFFNGRPLSLFGERLGIFGATKHSHRAKDTKRPARDTKDCTKLHQREMGKPRIRSLRKPSSHLPYRPLARRLVYWFLQVREPAQYARNVCIYDSSRPIKGEADAGAGGVLSDAREPSQFFNRGRKLSAQFVNNDLRTL